ncbi:hypothetical protein BSU04_18535 [Caballeronia sordidicola]|uniref:Uncharacterized protein n=1 Tax=Caballeronia sordidicola TaxID=196367 RepID=A0A226X209_CABSO|nr:hypothetical protein BSU04_18535 [Caballeronia sordidicola]
MHGTAYGRVQLILHDLADGVEHPQSAGFGRTMKLHSRPD